MRPPDEFIDNLYISDEYIANNPSLHLEDSPWKIKKIIPLIDKLFTEKHLKKEEVNLLDIGGGAGVILNSIGIYIEKFGLKVNKIALDLSPGMLEIQKENNPDLITALNEDIRRTSLSDKEIDLSLMIDVIEHIPNPMEAFEELNRISKFVILKVPLEDNFWFNAINFIRSGRPRQNTIESIGHINIYNFNKLKNQVEKSGSQVLDHYYTNVADYYLNSEHYNKKMKKIGKFIFFIQSQIFRISPKIFSIIFNDYVMMLIKCN